jgi:hypothetical protein
MADDKKNPLDVLEELLSEKGGGGASGGSVSAPASAKPKEKTESELALELESKRQELEQQQQEQTAVDEEKLAEHREAIIKIKDTQEYKARVQQDSEKKTELDKKASAEDGFEINQLDHTKV